MNSCVCPLRQRWRRSGFWKVWAWQREGENCYQVGVRLSPDGRSNDVSKVHFARWSPFNQSLVSAPLFSASIRLCLSIN